MNRIHQIDPGTATGKTKQLLDTVQRRFGFVPNLMRVFGNSAAALDGYLGFSGAAASGSLPAKLREQLALAVGEINGCEYCLSAHTASASRAGLAADDIVAARRSSASDPKADAVLKFARAVTLQRGHVSNAELQAARSAGLNDAELVEIIQHVALNTLTNYTNNVAATVVDFPKAKSIEPEQLAV
jgi:uncharacterized peroxidase-related enzyme